MLKVLIKKQFMEVGQWLFFDNKKGVRREGKSKWGYLLLMGFLFGYLMVIFGILAGWFANLTYDLEIEWFMFMLMLILSLLYGVFGSVFTTYATLYLPKDNDIMIPLPFKASDLVISRLSGVWIMGLFYEAMIFIPTIIVSQIKGGFNIISLLSSTFMMLIGSLFVLCLSAMLGYVVAQISVRLKSKAFVTVLISLGFFAGYWYVYTKILNGINSILTMVLTASDTIKDKAYFLYQLGAACTGNITGILIYTVIALGCTYLVFYVLTKSFFKLISINKGEKKVAYKQEKSVSQSVSTALFKRELARFTHSATYMLNGGLGILMMIGGAIYLVFNQSTIQDVAMMIPDEFKGMVSMIIVAMIAMIVSVDAITAPSVSLEGKNIWIIQTMPVKMWEVLKAKLKLGTYLNLIPAEILAIACCYVLKLEFTNYILIIALVGLITLFLSALGLIFGIKFVNLNWTSETAAVKQGWAVLLSLFGGWIIIITLGLLIYFTRNYISIDAYFTIFMVIFAFADRFALDYLKTKGANIVSHL